MRKKLHSAISNNLLKISKDLLTIQSRSRPSKKDSLIKKTLSPILNNRSLFSNLGSLLSNNCSSISNNQSSLTFSHYLLGKRRHRKIVRSWGDFKICLHIGSNIKIKFFDAIFPLKIMHKSCLRIRKELPILKATKASTAIYPDRFSQVNYCWL